MLEKKNIDLNADVGEGFNNEAQLMPYLSSCSIACGGHTGDEYTMAKVVKLAKEHKVKIGAHPSFPDTLNFGRLNMDMSPSDLFTSLKHQIDALLVLLEGENEQLHHIKPHGALYNLAAKDEKIAYVIIDVLKSLGLPVKLYVPYKSVIADLAIGENIDVVFEAFADRNYNEDLSLVSRQNSEALITKKEAVFNHVFKMIFEEKVNTLSGVEVPIKAATFCVHSDTKNAPEILQFLIQKLSNNNIFIY